MKRPWVVILIVSLFLIIDLAGILSIMGAGLVAMIGLGLLSLLMLPIYYWLYTGAKWSWILAILVSLANFVGVFYISSHMGLLARVQSGIEIGGGLIIFGLLLLPSVRSYYNQDSSDSDIKFDLATVAPPSRRVLAFIVDLLFASVIGLIFIAIYSFVSTRYSWGVESKDLIASALFAVGYLTIPLLSAFGGSLGQRIFKFKLVNAKGEKISLLMSIIRFIYVIFFGVVSIFIIFFDTHLRTIHDNITRTYMVSR